MPAITPARPEHIETSATSSSSESCVSVIQENSPGPSNNAGRLYPELEASAPAFPSGGVGKNTFAWASNEVKVMELRLRALQGTIIANRPANRWEGVVGAEEAKANLIRVVTDPFLLPEDVSRGIPFPGNIVLHGPHGCGKTTLLKSLAGELVGTANVTLIAISPSNILRPSLASSIQNVRATFELARRNSPALIIIDDFEEYMAIDTNDWRQEEGVDFVKKSAVIDEFLEQLYFFSPERELRVAVIATTSFPWKLDNRIWSYFENVWPVPYPNELQRIQVFKKFLYKTKLTNQLTEEDFNGIGKLSVRYAHVDLFYLVSDLWKLQWRNVRFTNAYRKVAGILTVAGEVGESISDESSVTPTGWEFVGIKLTTEPIKMEEVMACMNSRHPSARTGVPPMWITDDFESDFSAITEPKTRRRRGYTCMKQIKGCVIGFWSVVGTGFMYLLSQI